MLWSWSCDLVSFCMPVLLTQLHLEGKWRAATVLFSLWQLFPLRPPAHAYPPALAAHTAFCVPSLRLLRLTACCARPAKVEVAHAACCDFSR